MCDAIELIVMRSEREPFLDNFVAYPPSRRTAELEGFPWGALRHKTRLISPVTRSMASLISKDDATVGTARD